MELFPAIDVRGGRVARAHPETGLLAVARGAAAAGARWIHFVDLDRAMGAGDNRALTRAFLAEAPVPVQVGGHLHDDDAVAELLAWGAARVVLGPGAALDPVRAARLFVRHGAGRLAVGIDARDGKVVTRGTGEVLDLSPERLARRAREAGARTVIYADARRDGTLAGPDLDGARAIAALGLDVVVSGGVATLDDLRAARDAGLAGAVVGRALLDGRFTVAEALACLAG